ncbi:MAG: flagellar protein FlgN [Amphritea sp.]
MPTLLPLDQLNALTNQGSVLLDTLEKLLDQELDALTQRNIDQLQRLVTQKTEAMISLEENSSARNQIFSAAGVTPDKTGLEQFVSQLPTADADQFKAHWSKLERVLRAVNEKNKRNELIIGRNSRNIEQLLSILRGQNQKNVLYDQSGGKGNYSAQNRIGKA